MSWAMNIAPILTPSSRVWGGRVLTMLIETRHAEHSDNRDWRRQSHPA